MDKFHKTCLAILAVLLISVAADDVVVITEDNFDEQVGQHKDALIEFYAPWCGHCKKLAPEYEKLADSFEKAKSVLIGKVDCDEHKSICGKYGVSKYPTIQWFSKESLEPNKYEGARTAEALAEFINLKAVTNVKIAAIPSNVVVLKLENFDEVVLDKTKDVLVEFYAPGCGHCKTLAPIYEKVATAFKNDEDVVIANVDADRYRDLAQKYGVSGYPTLKFFPKGNKAGEDYEGGRDLEGFVSFINEKCGTSRDGKGQLTSEAGIVASLHALVKEFVAASDEEKNAAYSRLEEEAEKLKGSSRGYGKIYLKAAKKYMEKGADYAKNEIQHLERILNKAGIVASLHALVKEFVAASDEEKNAAYSRLEEEAEKLKGSSTGYGKIYLKAAKKYMEKGADYAKNEIQHLERILNKAGIVASLHALVKEFVAASDEEKNAAYSRLEEEAEKLKGSSTGYGKIYLKAAKKYMEKGADYAKNEIQHLERILNKAGIVASLHALVKEFVAASDEEKNAAYSRLEEEAEKLKGSSTGYGKIYLKAAKKYMEKGADYAKNEIQRLERILNKSINPAKADELTLEKNILSAFA